MSIEKPSRNEDEYFAKRDAELLKTSQEITRKDLEEAERKLHYMKCPKDGYDLETTKNHDVQVDVCPHCGGMWLDKGELGILLDRLEREPGMFRGIVRDVVAAMGRGKKDNA